MLLAALLTLGFVWASPFPPGFTTYNLTIANLPNTAGTSAIFITLVTAPTLGALVGDGRAISTTTSFFPAVLYYLANDPYAFSLNAGANCGPTLYDNATITIGREYANGTLLNSDHFVSLCGTDAQNLPTGDNLELLTLTLSPPNAFNFTIQDLDDRRGVADGLWSLYSTHQPNGAFSPNAGVRLLDTNPGTLVQCDTLAALVLNTTYPRSQFCFDWDGTNDTHLFRFQAVDTVGGFSDPFLLSVVTAKLTAPGLQLTTDSNVPVAVHLPHTLTSFYNSSVEFFIVAVPLNGRLLNGTGWPYTVGARFQVDAPLFYLSFPNYFNQYRFPDNTTSTNTSTGEPLFNCGQPACPDTFFYRAETTVPTTTGSVTYFSPTGAVGVMVDRLITEEMGVCDSPLYVTWNFVPCASLGIVDEATGVLAAGTDGRLTPSYLVVVDSLPAFGTLYHINGSGVNLILGPPVVIGDIVGTPQAAEPNFIYLPTAGYRNRYLYETNPSLTVSMVNDRGRTPPGCSQSEASADPLGPTCTDGFMFHTQSSYDGDVSASARYQLMISEPVVNNLTACWISGTSGWGTPCISYGFESNTIYNDYAIQVFLTADFVGGEEYTFTLETIPEHGLLYRNLGTDEAPVYGELVGAGAVILPMANTSWPQLLYVGEYNYFNTFSPPDSSTEIFVDLKNVPFGTCPNAAELGCFDSFKYLVWTATRTSNVGTYTLHVGSLVSNATLITPPFFQYVPNVPYYFGANTPIIYDDPDGDVYYVSLQFTVTQGILGSNISLEGMALRGDAFFCFNSTGCSGTIEIHALPSDMVRIFDGLYFIFNETVTSQDNFYVYMTMGKRLPDGYTSFNQFTDDPDDVALVGDMWFYSTFDGLPLDDYYYFDPYANGTLAPTPPFEIPDDYGCGMNCTGDNCTALPPQPFLNCSAYYAAENTTVTYNTWILVLSITCGLLGAMLLAIIVLMLWQRRAAMGAAQVREIGGVQYARVPQAKPQ